MTADPREVIAAAWDAAFAVKHGSTDPIIRAAYDQQAERALTALAEAGLAVVPAGETREQWATGPGGSRVEWSEQAARRRVHGSPAPIYRRTVHVGPWEPVT